MRDYSYFAPGQTIVLRQMFRGKIWEVRPALIIKDTPELLVSFLVHGTIWKKPVIKARPAQRLKKPWTLTDAVWSYGGSLRLTIPGERYSVLLLKNADGSFYEWYINLEEPMYRTRFGFDYEDNVLDVVISPDLSVWGWHDADELHEAVTAGLYSAEQADAFYADGKKAVEWIQSRQSPFNQWKDWKPNPSWEIPVLPDGWDVL